MHRWLVGMAVALWASGAGASTPMQVVLDVENMTCPACSITIAKALERVEGVSDTHVDAAAHTVTVTYDAQSTSATAVADAVTNAGFPAREKVRDD